MSSALICTCCGFAIVWQVIAINHDPTSLVGIVGGILFGGGIMYGMFGRY